MKLHSVFLLLFMISANQDFLDGFFDMLDKEFTLMELETQFQQDGVDYVNNSTNSVVGIDSFDSLQLLSFMKLWYKYPEQFFYSYADKLQRLKRFCANDGKFCEFLDIVIIGLSEMKQKWAQKKK